MADKKIAIVHERLTEIAGSEHVVEQLSVQWPAATVHAAIASPTGIPAQLSSPPSTTWLDAGYRALGRRTYAPLLPMMPLAFRGMKLGPVDAVVTSHHAFAAQVVFATDAPVIAYVHSPARWAWDPALRAGEADGVLGRAALTALSVVARRGELAAAPRLAKVVANSTTVAQRIRDWWGLDAIVVHPPVDSEGFVPDPTVPREDFFLLAGRLVPYKRPDLAVRAAREAGVRLVVVGDGRMSTQCRETAGSETTFLGRVPHEQLVDLHRRARALVMPGIEDFGIVPVEAMACGTPVLALGAGGALDTVRPGITGELIEGTSDAEIVAGFVEALRGFDPSRYDSVVVRQWAEGFSRNTFRAEMQAVVDSVR